MKNIHNKLLVVIVLACLTITLHRIDFSGVYALPDGIKVKAVQCDGSFISDYAITGNGNLDVFQARTNSVVTATIY